MIEKTRPRERSRTKYIIEIIKDADVTSYRDLKEKATVVIEFDIHTKKNIKSIRLFRNIADLKISHQYIPKLLKPITVLHRVW